MIVSCEWWGLEFWMRIWDGGRGINYPGVSEMHAVSVQAVLPRCLRDIGCDADTDGDDYVLEHKEPGPLINTRWSVV